MNETRSHAGRRTGTSSEYPVTDGLRSLALLLWPGTTVILLIAHVPATFLLAALGVEPGAVLTAMYGAAVGFAILGAVLWFVVNRRDRSRRPEGVSV